MQRSWHKWYSPNLARDMELLVFGHSGANVLVFPTRGGRFYDYENFGMIGAASAKIEAGALQIVCVDSIDQESLYSEDAPPEVRMRRHLEYELYILNEVLPLCENLNPGAPLVAHGCSLGAYHAVNIALRYPRRFSKVLALSGRYDLTRQMGPYRDLFEGYYGDEIYYNNPSHFIPNMWDEAILADLRRMNIQLVIGRDDAFYENNVEFSEALGRIAVPHSLDVWEGEAHRPRFWRPMVERYLQGG